jgi:uncharacterized protein (DUF1501 family)
MGCSAAIAAMAAGKVTQMTFANPALAAGTDEIFVMVFLRGGCDGLSLLSPFDDPIYRSARGNLALPTSGANAPLLLNPNNATYTTSSFGLNGKMPQLKELYDNGTLAMVHACGLNDDTRSHFDAMDYIERGTPGDKHTGTGWLTRHLQTLGTPAGLLPVVASGSAAPALLLSYSDAVAMSSPRSFSLSTGWRYNRAQENYPMMQTLKTLYPGGSSPLDKAGRRTVETIEAIRAANVGAYTPRAGVSYPSGSFGDALQTVAQVVKMEQGLQVATVDFGGWDTHESQASSDGSGYLPNRLGELSAGLYALIGDLVDYMGRLTVVVMSEFGRRLGANTSSGTDHGHGNAMMVLGGNVNGGTIYGAWPGLSDLDQGQDLRIETDFRVVLSEVITKRLGNTRLGAIFPGLTSAQYAPLGLLRGTPTGPIDWSAMSAGGALQAAPGDYKLYMPVMARCW